MSSSRNAQLLAFFTSAMAACGNRATVSADALVDASRPHDSGSAVDALHSGARDSAVAVMRDVQDASSDVAHDSREPDASPDARRDAVREDTGMPVSIRRPFLVGSSFRAPLPVADGAWVAASDAPCPAALPELTRRRLAAAWLKDALDEHASVAAFARFTLHLLSLGAPPDLVIDSQHASLDEVVHAQLLFRLAHRYGGVLRGPGPLPLQGVELETSLIEVVRIGVEEGCVGETLGAALAARALEVATDPEVVAVVRRIALDEARHAELAWRFLRWAIVVGGPAAREAARRGMERATSAALAMKVERYDDAIGDWHAHGRLTCEESRALSAEVIAEVIRPCLEVALAPGRTAASGHASSPGLPASSSRPWAG